MRHAKLYRYQLAMDSGVILRQERLTHREGYIIHLQTEQGQGYGEVAPLPGFSLETLTQIEPVLIELLELWVTTGQWPHDLDAFPPSVAFGLSMARMSLNGELEDSDVVKVAPLCSGDPDELLPILERMEGEPIAKMKVGFYEPIRDGILVNLFLESLPDLTVRLDANQQWNLDKALKFASYIQPQHRRRIAFIEEPCQSKDDSLEFAAQTQIAIAWDEQMQTAVRDAKVNELDAPHVGAWIIKPSLIGSVQRCQKLITQAQDLGLQVVISSSLESSIGLNQLRKLSAQYLPQTIPGLDTLQLFQQQLEHPWPNSPLPLLSLDSQVCVWEGKSDVNA
ncbi:MAG: o-succinylbenzoate synthase [Vibrio sp.]